MIDPITGLGAASSVVSVTHAIWKVVEYVKGKTNSPIISALLSWSCDNLEGSKEIIVEQLPIDNETNAWFYRVKDVEDYTFLRFPVIESGVYEQIGNLVGEDNPDARLFRWIASPPSSVRYGNQIPPNVKVNFIIIGYKPKSLVEYFTTR